MKENPEIDISYEPNGIYFLELWGANWVTARKIII
jgi:hypothetical protein